MSDDLIHTEYFIAPINTYTENPKNTFITSENQSLTKKQ